MHLRVPAATRARNADVGPDASCAHVRVRSDVPIETGSTRPPLCRPTPVRASSMSVRVRSASVRLATTLRVLVNDGDDLTMTSSVDDEDDVTS
jgi:hypothetical protein